MADLTPEPLYTWIPIDIATARMNVPDGMVIRSIQFYGTPECSQALIFVPSTRTYFECSQ